MGVLFICVDEQVLQQLRKVFLVRWKRKIRGKHLEGPLTMEASRLSLLLLWQEIGLGTKTFERLALEASQELKDAKAVAGRAAVSCAEAFLITLEADTTTNDATKKKKCKLFQESVEKQESEFGVSIKDRIHPTLTSKLNARLLG